MDVAVEQLKQAPNRLDMPSTEITIASRDYWFKVVAMLQQNWALLEMDEGGCTIYFIHDASGVFDQLTFDSLSEAEASLKQNGFARYADDVEAQKFMSPPEPPFHKASHPNGPIYSSGRYWRRLSGS